MTRDGRKRLLVVDDDEGMVATLEDILVAAGYDVEVAFSGEQALERVRQRVPDGILMDVRMPGLNGVETFREIKRLSPASFVIFMTAYAASTLVEEARREGAVEVIPKPLDLEHVLGLIADKARTTPVLVVDDDPAFCRSLGDALTAQRFDVHAARSVDDAIQLFRHEPRRVVILDMHLGGSNGLDVLLLLKEVNPRAVVILMTGFPDLQDAMRRGLEMSASACLMKPFEVDDLIAAIRGAVERQASGGGGPR